MTGLLESYLERQLAGDRRGIVDLVKGALDTGMSVGALHEVLRGAQHEIGRLWQENRISVAEEHMATAITQLALAYLYPRMPRRDANGKKVLVACVQGETHEMGARMGADLLEMSGFDVRFLGADVPVDSLESAAAAFAPDVIVLSVVLDAHLPALDEAVAKLRGRAALLAAAGPAIEARPDRALSLGVTLLTGRGEEAVLQTLHMLGITA
jgi:methanogenic corrinoid protein MtbC1